MAKYTVNDIRRIIRERRQNRIQVLMNKALDSKTGTEEAVRMFKEISALKRALTREETPNDLVAYNLLLKHLNLGAGSTGPVMKA